ncbi:hypothetical protein HanIR_Chr17g0897651 [Helianthus annuus]|nr:hypothetical protein HanIR_Chr17g0897651 [Helianthus annuus]
MFECAVFDPFEMRIGQENMFVHCGWIVHNIMKLQFYWIVHLEQVLEGFLCTYPGLRVETLGCDSRSPHDNSRLDSRLLRLRLPTSTTRDQNVVTRDLLVATRDRVFSSRDRLVSTGLPTMVIGPQHVLFGLPV